MFTVEDNNIFITKGNSAFLPFDVMDKDGNSYVVQPDDAVIMTVKKTAEEAIGPDKVHITETPSLGCDDFAYFCSKSKGLYFNLGAKNDSDNDPSPIHSETFNPDESCIRTGILIEVLSVLRIMEENLQ